MTCNIGNPGLTHSGALCLECGDFLFSRAVHDYRSCTCGAIAVDGGWDYIKVSGTDKASLVEVVLPSRLTRKKLYEDWNFSLDKEGLYRVGSWPGFVKKAISSIKPISEMTFPNKESQHGR